MNITTFIILLVAISTFVSMITGGLSVFAGVVCFILLWIMWNIDKGKGD
jgi:hypothetical protein